MTTFRFTFMVGVSSPFSMVNSSNTRNFLMVSNDARSWFFSAMTDSISS